MITQQQIISDADASIELIDKIKKDLYSEVEDVEEEDTES